MADAHCTPLDALIQLNGHARAYGCGKRAIYAYKTLVAGMFGAQRALLGARLLKHEATCRYCDGTTVYRDWDGYSRGVCFRCKGGKVTLRFLETTLPNGRVWHHPFEHGGWEIASMAGLYEWDSVRGQNVYRVNGVEQPEEWHAATDWAPNQPAVRLDPDRAAALLNLVEPWVTEITSMAGPWRWQAESALREMRGYRIDLGRVGAKCWYCDSTEIVIGLGRMGYFDWAAPVCEAHSKMPVEMWPTSHVLPESALTPALNEWLVRHRQIGFQESWHH